MVHCASQTSGALCKRVSIIIRQFTHTCVSTLMGIVCLLFDCFSFLVLFVGGFVSIFFEFGLTQSSGSDESLAAGNPQLNRPRGPLVLRLGPGASATLGGPVGTQQDGEVVCCGFFSPHPPLPSCSSSSSASLLLVAAPLPSQPISSRLVRGAAYS